METGLYKIAAIEKYRFNTSKGLRTVEEIIDLPLRTKQVNGVSLDLIAKGLYAQIQNEVDISFVDKVSNKLRTELETKLAIVKDIISEKQNAIAAKENKMAVKLKDELIDQLIQDKETKSLSELSVEELKKLKSTNK